MTDAEKSLFELLVLHNGACSVARDSKLAHAASEIQKSGLLLTNQATTSLPVVEVRLFNYGPR